MDADRLDSAISELQAIVEELQGEDAVIPLDDLIALGSKLPSITYALAHGTRAIREHVLELVNIYAMSDSRGQEVEESIIESADALRALNTLLERADPAAREYYDHVRYLVVDRELDPGEPPAHEVRTATAADMARRVTSTTHVDKEPANLMNDTILGSRVRP